MKLRSVAKILFFNVLFLLVLLEIAGLAGYYQRTGEIYYLNPPRGRRVAESLEGTVEGYRLHPYLGFVIRPGVSVGGSAGLGKNSAHNNYGFISAHDYPRPRHHPRELLVGIFGGSAAAHLATFETEHGILANHLARVNQRAPTDVTVLNFAQGGFKQPQQLQIYSYFLSLGQELDLVINFDGFNDMVLSGRNIEHGFAPDMPSYEHLGALRDMTSMQDSSDNLGQMLAVRDSWAKYSAWYNRAWSGDTWESPFAAGFFVDWLIYKLHHRRFMKSRLALAASATDGPGDAWLHLRPDLPARQPDAAEVEALAALWSRSTIAMSQLAAARDALFFELVQPNQYFPTERVFTSEEAQIALSPVSPYRPHVEIGYPRLLVALEQLAESGIKAESLTHLFDPIDEPVYVDDCCHFNDHGQALLLEHIGQKISRERGLK